MVIAAVLLAALAQGDFDALAARARAALEAERVPEAIELYGRATKVRPGWVEGWWRLGTLLYDSKRYAEARGAFVEFTALEKKAGPGYAMLGLCEFELKKYPEAMAALERGVALGLGPDREFSRQVLYRDASVQTLLGRPEAALQRLTLLMNDAAAARPGAPATALLGDEEAVEAMGLATLRIARLPSDIPEAKRALVRQAGRAQALVALQDLPAAAVEFRKLAEEFGKEPGVHYAYGVFLSKQNPPEALGEFQKEIEIAPKDSDAQAQAALECFRAGTFEQGRKYAAEAVRLAPRNFAARVVLARLALALEDVTAAIQEAQAAVKLAPDSPDAHFTLSRALARAGRAQEAERERAEFERLKKTAP